MGIDGVYLLYVYTIKGFLILIYNGNEKLS